MSELAKLQAAFLAALVEENANALLSAIVGTHKRVEIYQDGYHARLLRALELNFPLLANYLSPREFAAYARSYLAQYHSHSYTLQNIGQELAAFLGQAAQTSAYPRTELAEIAALDLALLNANFARDEASLTRKWLQTIAADEWHQITFKPTAHWRIVSFTHNTIQCWLTDRLTEQELSPLPATTSENYLIWRGHDHITYYRQLDTLEEKLLRSIREQDTKHHARLNFGELCQILSEHSPPSTAALVETMSGLLQRWLDQRLLLLPAV